MSHTVSINYEQIAVQCHSICEVAQRQLNEMEALLAELEKSASRLSGEQTIALKREIEKEQKQLQKSIEAVLLQADNDAQKGIVTGDSDRLSPQTYSSITVATELQSRVNQLASTKLVQMRALLDTLLSDSIQENAQRLMDRANGIVRMTADIEKLLENIGNEVLRQFTYVAYLSDPTLSGDALLQAGESLMTETAEARQEKEAELIRAELAVARIPKEETEKIVSQGKSLSEIRTDATAAIVGEKVREKSLRIIMKAIKERGFIVDKNNIRIDRDKNEVTLIALKASGERATFKVYLDGKFIYDFHGYEGQACQKDIEPFMDALESVYGMHITSKQEIWSNPDKISTMKYQAMNTNKNRG